MLYVPGNTWGFTWDNLSTTDTPPSTAGLDVTAHASADTKGSWVNISTTNKGAGAVTTLAREVSLIYLLLGGGSASTVARSRLVDIGFDPAGGTTYQLLASNLMPGPTTSVTGSPWRVCLPVQIPAGSSVAARAAANVGGSTNRVAAIYYGAPSNKTAFFCGQGVESIGVPNYGSVPANSEGVAITPGNSGAWSSWTSLGTSTRLCRFWNLAAAIRNATTAALYYYFELGYGDATNPVKIVNRSWGQTDTSERMYWYTDSFAACEVPAGSTLYARATCSGTADTGFTAAAYGVY